MAGMHLDVMESAPHYEIDRSIADELIFPNLSGTKVVLKS